MNGKKDDTNPDWKAEDDAPEWTDEMFDRAEFAIGDKIIRPATGTFTRDFTPEEIRARRGRPPLGETAKVQQSLRLSREVVEHFRSTGPGWQARIDEVLRRHVAEARGAEPDSSDGDAPRLTRETTEGAQRAVGGRPIKRGDAARTRVAEGREDYRVGGRRSRRSE